MINKLTFHFLLLLTTPHLIIFLSPLHSESSILIEANLPGARVYIDGELEGSTDVNGRFFANADPGFHLIALRKDRYRDYQENILVEDLTTILTVQMRSIDGQLESELIPEGNGAISVAVNVNGARVRLDGELIGITDSNGQLFKMCSAGEHEIVLEKPGYWTLKQKILATPGAITEINTVLEPRELISRRKLLLYVLLSFLISIVLYFLYRRYYAPGKFDRYDRRETIKKGGTGTVYRARDSHTGEMVALKIMHKHLTKDKNLAVEFLDEGEKLSTLNSKYPDVPIIHWRRHGRKHDKTDGQPFIAMDFVAGENLAEVIANGPLEINDAVFVANSLCNALRAVHAEGITHEDLSPENIVVSKDFKGIQQITLLDFGFPRRRFMKLSQIDSSINGKLPYMSPEQCNSDKIDSRSDIYSLGILLFTLLTGRPPFVSASPLKVIGNHQTVNAPLLPDYFPSELRNLIDQMLQKNPDDRIQSVDPVSMVLEQMVVY